MVEPFVDVKGCISPVRIGLDFNVVGIFLQSEFFTQFSNKLLNSNALEIYGYESFFNSELFLKNDRIGLHDIPEFIFGNTPCVGGVKCLPEGFVIFAPFPAEFFVEKRF